MLEWMTVISLTVMAAVVPGPDFVVVTRNALAGGRAAGIMTAAGIALALVLHVSYALAGIALIVSQSIFLFTVLKLLGAAYLLFLGVTMWRGASRDLPDAGPVQGMSPWKALRWGFFTNATNPKATLFVMAVFLQATSPETVLATKIAYGAVMAGGVFAWFVLVSLFFNLAPVRSGFLRAKLWIERVFGALLSAFGFGLALSVGPGR